MSSATLHSSGHGTETIHDPGTFATPSTLRTIFIVSAVIGLATLGYGLSQDALKTRTWTSFAINHFYFMSLAIGGVFFAAIQWLTNAMWSAPLRRIAESFAAYLPFALVTFVLLCVGMHTLYHWTHPEAVAGDLLLQGKSGYLNQKFFIGRNIVAFVLWIFFARKMISNSVSQDASKGAGFFLRNRALAPAFLAIFGVTYTMASFDQLMSLDPHWFSTMFGVYCFAGLFYSTLALICIMALYLKGKGKLAGILNDNHLHDLGKFMFAFTVFWAYIGFSQYMLIWYANLPEETGYFLRRSVGGWFYVSTFLAVGKFALPFFLLLPRGNKRNEKILMFAACFMMVAQWIDVMWLVQPEFYADGPKFGLMEIGMTLGFAGVFGLTMFRFLANTKIVAMGDPHLKTAVFHHHV